MSCSRLEVLAVLLPDAGHFADDIINVQHHLHHGDLLVIDGGIELSLHFGLAHMENRESQRDSCQRTGISGIAIGHCLSGQTGGLALGSAQQNDDVRRAILLGDLLDSPLILRSIRTSASQTKAPVRENTTSAARPLAPSTNT